MKAPKPIEFTQSMFDKDTRTIRREIISNWDSMDRVEEFFVKLTFINMKSAHTKQIKTFFYSKRVGNRFWFHSWDLDAKLELTVIL